MKIRAALGALAVLGGFATTTFAGERRVDVRDDHRVVETRRDDRVIVRDDHRDVDHDRFDRDRFDRDHRVVVHVDDYNLPVIGCR